MTMQARATMMNPEMSVFFSPNLLAKKEPLKAPGEFRKSGIAYEKVKETLEYITENKQNKNNFF